MSPCFEFEDKTVEKAVQKACKELNLPEEELRFDVISYGSSGIFGLVGTKKARIRVTVADQEPEPEPHPKDAVAHTDALQAPPAESAEEKKTVDVDECVLYPVADDPKAVGKEALQRIIDAITTDAKITIKKNRGRILFNVNGGNSAVLIGKRGQTLEAIQYLVEKMINKGRDERVRIQIDVEGYLENRRANLKKLAGRLAEKVRRTGRPATIGQMNAHDRRIVHIALRDNHEVRTQSMGDGYIRKLVIFPKKNVSGKKKYSE